MNKKLKIFSSIFLSLFLFVFAFSITWAKDPVKGVGPTSPDDLIKIIENIAGWFQVIVLTIGIFMIIFAGLVWMTAGGDEEKLGKARRMLIWGLVGIAIALAAYAAEEFVKSTISTQ